MNQMRLSTTMALVSLFFLIALLNSNSHLAQATEIKPTAEHVVDQNGSLQTYIVHVRKPVGTTLAESTDNEAWLRSYLPRGIDSSEEDRMIYAYGSVIRGFAARLTQEEVNDMAKKDGFVQAHPERIYQPQTTHTPHFLGLQQEMGFWNQSNFGRGVIIGVLDTGIFPDHPSFSDHGMPPPPAKWRGKCELSKSKCNNKLIGARSFIHADKKKGADTSPIDEDGHGTHTSSTAAGNFVKNVDVLGNAKGTAVGMAPHAHLAMYKVCNDDGCSESDVLAALDAAIHDGVDVISISLGGDPGIPLFKDSIAVGTYAATQRGIFVSCAAGNSGPYESTLSNEAPWFLTVGASTVDRKIVATAKLGNGEEFDGQSLYRQTNFDWKLLPLVDAGKSKRANSTFCGKGALKGMDVKGKVVVCQKGGDVGRIAKGQEVKDSGGAAMILLNGKADGFTTIVDAHVLPSTYVSFEAGQKIKAYLKATKKPTATLYLKGTVIGNSSATAVTAFSSRGPTLEAKGILKPDIVGPGASIVAAWPFPLEKNRHTKSTFDIQSGTSMSCPHLSGIAALLKSSHPYWSPAVIKSAMMTTADLLSDEGKHIIDQNHRPANFFATGSGHVNPTRANDPGLVYDIQPEDYIPYLCGLGYNDHDVGIIAHKHIKCSKQATKTPGHLNYPSFSVTMGTHPQTFSRTVTNVGEANSSYTVTVLHPFGIDVIVRPSNLKFSKTGQKATYTVTFSRGAISNIPGATAEGFIKWVSDKHFVRSPISVIFK